MSGNNNSEIKYKGYGNFDRYPNLKPKKRAEAFVGWERISERVLQLALSHTGERTVIVCELYPGVYPEDPENALIAALSPSLVINADRELKKSPGELNDLLDDYMTDDRVFGRVCPLGLSECLDPASLERARAAVSGAKGRVLVIGTGASLVCPGDVTVYCDITRREIQLRYRSGSRCYTGGTGEDDFLTKYKRGYFIEWRMADALKRELSGKIELHAACDRRERPVAVSGNDCLELLHGLCNRPFRSVPYFDPGVWGGQWMKNLFGLPENGSNYAWSFDGVPEENGVCFDIDGECFELPCKNLVDTFPAELLGKKVYERFGAEFPIRFDMLDTMGGQNLSLQVHPKTEYISNTFGMAYTQDESYYILDAEEGSSVYLGLREGTDAGEFERALRDAQEDSGKPFDALRFVNRFPVKKHDHVLIPAGTVHCSGAGTMVLEISATPFIFTFKLWDWGRLGLDGKPRPIHIDRGMKNIAFDRDTEWVGKNLLHRERLLSEEDGFSAVCTGLHESEFIITRRLTIEKEVTVGRAPESVQVMNLVEGREVTLRSPAGDFDDLVIHYAETFIVPAGTGELTFIPRAGERVMLIEASVRS